jgi:type I restriction enzyme S subunit
MKTGKLFDVLELQRGFDLPASQRLHGDIPVISSSGCSGYHNEYRCSVENVITGRYGTIGEVYYYRGECWPLNTALFVKDFKGNSPLYVYYLLQYILKVLQVDGKDKSTVPGVDRNVLHQIKVTYHEDIKEQQIVTSVLACIDKKINVNNRISSELETMAKTLYDYWFTQFDFPDENGKPYRTSGGKMVWNEQLKREIPEGWEVVTVDSVLGKTPNTTRVQTSDYLREGNLPIVDQSTDFIAGFTNDNDALLHSEAGFIVFGDHTRIVKYIRFPFARGADGTQVLKSNTARMPDELLYQAVNRIDLSNYGYARHFKFLKDSMIILPDRIIAQKFKEVVAPLYERQVKCHFENIELARLRDWLLPMLMNGQAVVE